MAPDITVAISVFSFISFSCCLLRAATLPLNLFFQGKVADLKKHHKRDMKEMTELATVISGAKQAPPEPIGAAASAVVRLNAIIKKHRDSK